MDAQQEASRVLNFEQLDLILSFIPDPAGAKVLRDQFVSACRNVEGKEDDANALHRSAESQSDLLQAQLKELEIERKAFDEQKKLEIDKLKSEQAKLENLARTLDERFQDLTTNVGQMAGNVNDCQKAVAEKLEGLGDVISARASGRENNVNQSLRDLLASAGKNAEGLSTMYDRSTVLATHMESVKDAQKRIESSIKDGVTMQGIKDQIAPLDGLVTTIKNVVERLPTIESFNTKFAQVGGFTQEIRELHGRVNSLVRENEDLKNQNKNLTTERDAARNLSEQARTALEELDDDLKQKMSEIEELRNQTDSKIEDLHKVNDDLRDRLIGAGLQISEGQKARRELDRVQHKLQTAETCRQELTRVQGELQKAAQTEAGLKEKIADLKRRLESEKTEGDKCSSQLTDALANQRDVIRQKQNLEDDLSKVQNELKELRSQQTFDLQKQLKDQWTAVSNAMKEQLSEKRTHEEAVRQLTDSWSSEKKALRGQISANVPLIESLQQQVQTLQSKVCTLEPVQGKLNTANENINRMSEDLDEARDNLRNSQRKVTELEEKVNVSTNELDLLKAENGRLEESGKSVSEQLRTSKGTINSLQQRCDSLNGELSNLRAHSVSIPEGGAGEVSMVYYKAADELRDIPIVINTDGELSTPQLAAQLMTLIDWYNWKGKLLTFLQSRSNDWVCLQQIMSGASDGKADGDKCKYHNDCLLVKVAYLHELPGLKFMMSR
ncbi:hypothetical protein F52700_2480 [Fusarium sp. NRRL 52700]|nr:hypothetical protein F52700_2480 [Fusarium sp. NRRL 52700]